MHRLLSEVVAHMPETAGLELPEVPRLQRETSQQYAYSRLRHSLMIGAIAPGRAITIRGIAQALGLSATPVREALRRLSSEHAIKVLANRRIVVPQLDPRRFRELLALRITIERHAAVRALDHVSDGLVAELAEIDRAMDAAIERHHHAALVTLNHKFHAAIYTANPDQIVMPVIESVWLQLGPFQRAAAVQVRERYRVDRHREILEALSTRDAAALGAAVEADISDAIGWIGSEGGDAV